MQEERDREPGSKHEKRTLVWVTALVIALVTFGTYLVYLLYNYAEQAPAHN